MVTVIEIPQRSDNSISHTIAGDVLTITVNDVKEAFDFTGLPEGIAESIEPELLPVNPIVSAVKAGDTVTVQLIRFYSRAEKAVFENG